MKKIFLIIALLFSVISASDVFNVSTIDGKKLTFVGSDKGIYAKEYKGKVLLLEFWGTWCAPCLMSIPNYVELQKEYKDKLKIVAIEVTEHNTKESVANFVKSPKNIKLSTIEDFLNRKAKTKEDREFFKKPVEKLKAYIKNGEPINYDIVAYSDAKNFINYVAQRAQWMGGIPFMLIFDKNGTLTTVHTGVASKEELEKVIKNILKKK